MNTQNLNEAESIKTGLNSAGQVEPLVMRLPLRAFFYTDFEALCPNCAGSGKENTIATTVISICRICRGNGVVRIAL